MALIIVLLAIPLLLCVRGLWAAHYLSRSPRAGELQRPRATASGLSRAGRWAGPLPEEVEELVVAARLAGALEQREYQQAMARLARADDARSPLQVPGAWPGPGGE